MFLWPDPHPRNPITRYRVSGLHRDTGISLSIAVDARDPEHARKLADEHSLISDDVVDIGPSPVMDYRAPTSSTSASTPIDFRAVWDDVRPPSTSRHGEPVAGKACMAIATIFYMVAILHVTASVLIIHRPEGVSSFPWAFFDRALGLTAAALLDASSAGMRLLARIAPRA